MLEPITRIERILCGESFEPINRYETFLLKAMGHQIKVPEPISRRERILNGENLKPESRAESYLEYLVGTTDKIPATISRFEYFIKEAVKGKEHNESNFSLKDGSTFMTKDSLIFTVSEAK